MSYAYLFENAVGEIELTGDISMDVAGLNPEQRAAVLAWVAAQADRRAAEARLREVLQHALFDLTAAEVGVLLNKPGSA
jgi:hypothetical protein